MPPNRNAMLARIRTNLLPAGAVYWLCLVNFHAYGLAIFDGVGVAAGLPGRPPLGQLLGRSASPAYLAGNFDAEGRFRFRQTAAQAAAGHGLFQIVFSQSNPALLAAIRLVTCGGAQPWAQIFRIAPAPVDNEGLYSHGNPSWELVLSFHTATGVGAPTVVFLQAILPFLIVKRQEALLMLAVLAAPPGGRAAVLAAYDAYHAMLWFPIPGMDPRDVGRVTLPFMPNVPPGIALALLFQFLAGLLHDGCVHFEANNANARRLRCVLTQHRCAEVLRILRLRVFGPAAGALRNAHGVRQGHNLHVAELRFNQLAEVLTFLHIVRDYSPTHMALASLALFMLRGAQGGEIPRLPGQPDALNGIRRYTGPVAPVTSLYPAPAGFGAGWLRVRVGVSQPHDSLARGAPVRPAGAGPPLQGQPDHGLGVAPAAAPANPAHDARWPLVPSTPAAVAAIPGAAPLAVPAAAPAGAWVLHFLGSRPFAALGFPAVSVLLSVQMLIDYMGALATGGGPLAFPAVAGAVAAAAPGAMPAAAPGMPPVPALTPAQVTMWREASREAYIGVEGFPMVASSQHL